MPACYVVAATLLAATTLRAAVATLRAALRAHHRSPSLELTAAALPCPPAVGNALGAAALSSKLIKREHLAKTEQFYEKYGGKTGEPPACKQARSDVQAGSSQWRRPVGGWCSEERRQDW